MITIVIVGTLLFGVGLLLTHPDFNDALAPKARPGIQPSAEDIAAFDRACNALVVAMRQAEQSTHPDRLSAAERAALDESWAALVKSLEADRG